MAGAWGILGGSFDPPHLGHLAIARDAWEQLGLEKVFLVPALQSPLRSATHRTAFDHRVGMCRAMAEPYPWLDVSAIEGELPQPSYTINTVSLLSERHPGQNLVWIIGADQLHRLLDWHRIDELVQMVEFTVASRPASTVKAPPIPGLKVRTLLPRWVDISSSKIREKMSKSVTIDDSVAGEVIDYIRMHELYRTITA